MSSLRMILTMSIRLRRFFKRVAKSTFVGNVITVGGGIAVGQAIALAFAPAITRLYGPEAFGAAAAFATLISIISPISTLGYVSAIVIADNDDEANSLARLSVLCAIAVSAISVILIYPNKAKLIGWSGIEKAELAIYFIPAALIVSAFLSIANQAAIRQGLFKVKALIYVGSTFLTNLAKLFGGMHAPSSFLLIFITLAGSSLNLAIQIFSSRQQKTLAFRRWFGLRGIGHAAWVQRDFALYRMPQSVIRAASIGLPVIILSSLFGSGPAGQYALTVLILGAPVSLLGDAVGEVFYQKITRAIRVQSDDVFEHIKLATIILVVLGASTFGVTALFGDWIFPRIFGMQWSRAGEYSQWISLWMISMLASRPAVSAMPSLRLQGALLIYELIVTVGRTLALYFGSRFGDDLSSVAAFSLVNLAGYVALISLVFYKVSIKKRKNKSA